MDADTVFNLESNMDTNSNSFLMDMNGDMVFNLELNADTYSDIRIQIFLNTLTLNTPTIFYGRDSHQSKVQHRHCV